MNKIILNLVIILSILSLIILSGCISPKLSNIHLIESDDPYTNILRIDSAEMAFDVEYKTVASFIDTIAKESPVTGVDITPTGLTDLSDIVVTVKTKNIVEVSVSKDASDSAVFTARKQGITFEGNKEVERIYYEGYITFKGSDNSFEIIFDDYDGGQ